MEYKLKHPIEISVNEGEPKTSINALTFTRIKAKHIKLLPDSLFEEGGGALKPLEVIPLIAGLCGITNEIADELDLADLRAISEEVLPSFLAEFQEPEKK